MGQVSVAALGAVSLPGYQSGAASPSAQSRAQIHALVSAVNVLNQANAAGNGREVTYSTDSATKELVISVVDKESKQVLVQWPSQYALDMAQDFQKEFPNDESLF
jgi:uncharacterized FlaG/YvyC family protein